MGISLWTFPGGQDISLGLAFRAGFPGLEKLEEKEREMKIEQVAGEYHKTICGAVKAVDPNHLILGDRFNGNKGISDRVLDAMKDHVDVFSVQYFCEPSKDSRMRMVRDLKGWSERCSDKPVLVADIGNWCAADMNPQRKSGLKSQQERGEDYVECGRLVLEQSCGYI